MSEGEAEPTRAGEGAPLLREHSNANLLKIDTNDRYSNVTAIRKFIAKSLGNRVDASTASPILPGLRRMNKNPRAEYLFLSFETEQDRERATQLLQQVTYRGVAWKSVPVTQRDLAVTHKGGAGVKRRRDDDADADASKLTQYAKYPIEQQLEMKTQHCLKVMKAIVPKRLHGWSAYSNRFLGMVQSPLLEGYRNHVNLSFGRTADGSPSLGFLTGSLMEGRSTIESAVEEGKAIPTMNVVARLVAAKAMQVFHEFAQGPAALEVFDKVVGKGFWRRLQVRHNVSGEVMMDFELDEDSVPADVFARVKCRLVEALMGHDMTQQLQQSTGLGTSKVVSLQYHKHSGVGSLPMDAERVVIAGAATLTETLAGLSYELSPTAFFQVNTHGMEKLLERVQEAAELRPTTTLMDLCSGTGTIGLALSRYVKRVIGIELVSAAVENARRNAERNHITNAEFHCGRVEHRLPSVIGSLSPEDRADMVAVLDPPRAGVSSTVLKWVRGTPTIRRVVYISCEQSALERDCPGLTKPCTKAFRGVPFEVTGAFAVDLFPHTHHVEMVVVLTRRPDEGGEQNRDEGPPEGQEVEEAEAEAEEGGGEGSEGGDDDGCGPTPPLPSEC